MAVNQTFVIFGTEAGWRIGTSGPEGPVIHDVEVPTDAGPEQIAQAVRQSLDAAGYCGENVLLAPAGQSCLCARISLDGLPKNNRRQAMIYRLEEKLPLPAEEIAADFIEADEAALGVCINAGQLQPVVEALEKAGAAVASITPAAILAIQGITEELIDYDLLVWGEGEWVNLFVLTGGRPTAWHLLPRQAEDLAPYLRLKQTELRRPLRIAVREVESDLLRRAIGSRAEVEVDPGPPGRSMIDTALASAAGVIGGVSRPWIELRRDALRLDDPYRQVRPAFAAALVGLVLLLATLSGSLLWRAHDYGSLSADLEHEQRQLFAELFPGQNPPLAATIRRRLEIEQRTLSGQSQHVHPQAQVLPLLYDALVSLPQDRRWRLLEMRLSPNELYLDGEARTHGDADAIAAALRGLPRFRIDPPATEQKGEQVVAFKITGAAPPPESARQGRRP